jgi:hypothetical protein
MSLINFNPEVIRDFFWSRTIFAIFQNRSRCSLYLFSPWLFPTQKKDAASIGAKNQNRFPFSKVLNSANYY